MDFKFGPTHLKIIKAVNAAAPIYAVGGCVRDAILGIECHDIDFATSLNFPALGTVIRNAGLNWIADKTTAEHGIYRVIDPVEKGVIDVAVFRKDLNTDGRYAIVEFTDNITDDLSRRDLTINAMAVALNSDGTIVTGLIDPFNGWADLAAKRVRLVGKPEDRITEDYLRMLRVARFATKLGIGATIDQSTIEACRANASKISGISKERIREEIVKALGYQNAGWMFRHMQTLGLLEYIIPDLHKGTNTQQGDQHFDCVFEHLCFCVDHCIGKKYTPMLKLATLFHDIAKPHTKKIINNQPTFHNHEIIGASLVYNWMKEYKFSNTEIQYVVKCVRHHQWRFYDDSKEKSYRKWLQEVGKNHWRDLIRLRMADRRGNRAKTGRPTITRKMRQLVRIVRNIINKGQPLFTEDLALNGNDLKALGLKPGPEFKNIMSNILGIVVHSPEKNTKAWLTNFVKRNYINKDKNDPS